MPLSLNPIILRHIATVVKRGYTYENGRKAKADLTIARDKEIDIIASFYNDYENVEEFEKKNGVQLPEDIKAMLTQR